jgi:uncharacterized protein (DUF1800 family)
MKRSLPPHRLWPLLPIVFAAVLAACGDAANEEQPPATAAEVPAPDSPVVESFENVPPTAFEAQRFLGHATFGGSEPEITALTKSSYRQWLTEQTALPPSSAVAALDGDVARLGASLNGSNFNAMSWQAAVLRLHITAPDQLRMRVTDALSQIFVVSIKNETLWSSPFAIAAFNDVLARNALGNFRQLLEDVSLSPAMGVYLSHAGNMKEDPAKGRLPDENYAREVMQLFSIGLWQLNPDGTRKTDGTGSPIPTYGQTEILGMARVFTGLGPATCAENLADCFYFAGDLSRDSSVRSMRMNPNFHSNSSKTIVGGATLAAGRSGQNDLTDALDALFMHPNVGPFIGRQLIKRLTTSNPGPEYVRRVAAAFDNNGAGVRGDLKAVVTAILLDPEVRSPKAIDNLNHGKLREPYQRVTHLLRATQAKSRSGGIALLCDAFAFINCRDNGVGQSPYMAASVFNFYRPDYMPAGELSALQLSAPELQIIDETTIAGTANYMFERISYVENDNDPGRIVPQLAPWFAIADNSAALVDRLNLVFMGGTMSAAMRSEVIQALSAIGKPTDDATRRERIQQALRLILLSPEYMVQR